MFSALPESKPPRGRRVGRTAASFVVHYGMVLALLLASAEAAAPPAAARQESIVFQHPREPESPPPVPELVGAPPPPPREVTAFTAPLDIPVVLPPVDLGRPITDSVRFSVRPSGIRTGSGAATSTRHEPGAVHTAREVEHPASLLAGAQPAYPEALRRAGVEGDVLVSYVVDTLGRAEMSTFTVLRSSQEQFVHAVRRAVARQTFTPATIGAARVRQLVQQPFSFSIVR